MTVDLHAQACRRLWASVLLAVLDDHNAAHAKAMRPPKPGLRRIDPASVLEGAARYLESANGRKVAALAGVDVRLDTALAMIALPRAEFKARLLADRPKTEAE